MSKKTKKGPHPHDKKEQQQIAGCPRCRGKEVVNGSLTVDASGNVGIGSVSHSAPPAVPLPDTSGLAPLEVLPLSSVPLEAEPDKAPDAPPTAPVGFSPH